LDDFSALVYIQCRYGAGQMTTLAKWGNSVALRIPKNIAEEAGLREGDRVELSVENGAIAVRPARPAYTLEELVGRITPRNRHAETDWGGPAGNESW
jgi:antitoxin MazE